MLQTLGGCSGNPEEERLGAYYTGAWTGEGTARYLHARAARARRELDHALLNNKR